MSLSEFDIIKKYFQRQARQPSVLKSIGDDCAILSHDSSKYSVMSMDTMVVGRHFPKEATAFQIGTRALCTSLSDLAAMGATPLYFTLGLTLPQATEAWLSEFSAGLFSIAESFSCDLIGGDTTQGPLTITVQVHGEVDKGCALARDEAQIGDVVFVSGTLGDGAAALALIQDILPLPRDKKSLSEQDRNYLLQRFYAPVPQIITGQRLLPYANAAIDISDGLLADAQHICEQSQVSMTINVDQLPLSNTLNQFHKNDAYPWALTGGDDYQLLFTVSSGHAASVQSLIDAGKLDAQRIGHIHHANAAGLPFSSSSSVHCLLDGQSYTNVFSKKGYQHFVP